MFFFILLREIHPDGLPPSYTLILLFRLLPDSPKDAFDLWQVSDSSNNPEVGLTLNRKCHFLYTHSKMPFYSECMQLSTGADMLTNRSCLHNIVCIMAGKPLVESYLAEPYFLCFQLPAKPSHSTTRIIGASSKKSPSVMKELKGSFMEASTR